MSIRNILSLPLVERVHDVNLQPNFEVGVISLHLDLFNDSGAHVVLLRVHVLNHDAEDDVLPNLLLDSFRDA